MDQEKAMAIMQVVSSVKKLTVEEMISSCRVKPLPYVRSLAVYFLLTNNVGSWPSIAEKFGFKSKVSVFNCYHSIRTQMALYDDVKADLSIIENRLKEAI